MGSGLYPTPFPLKGVMILIESALFYESVGLSVIPVHTIVDGECSCGSKKCNAKGKHPRIRWKGQTDRRFTASELREFWERHPDSNVGIVTGSISGITVIDIDGEEGLKSMAEAGFPLDEMPVTASVNTGGGGIHLVYRYPERVDVKTKAGILPKVDIRSDGGFIVAPPSVHVSGGTYEWISGRSLEDMDPTDFDFGLLVGYESGKESKPKVGEKWYEVYLKGVGEGKRNDAAAKLAGRYFSMGMTQSEVMLLLKAWNTNNTPPMSHKEIATVVESIKSREYEVASQEKEEWLESISSILRVNLSSVKRITGDNPQFVLEFDEGTCIMSTADLLSPKIFQQSVAEATKVIVKKLSIKTNPTHDRLVQMVMNCAEDVDAGMEATEIGELTTLLKDFILNQRVSPEIPGEDEVPVHGSFRMDGLVWMSLMDLVQRSGARWGVRISIKQMAQRLRVFGVERKVFKVEDGSSRIMWGVDPDKVGIVMDKESVYEKPNKA